RHLIIGGSSESYLKLTKLVRKEIDIAHFPLPFLSPEEFDYDEIANYVNKSKPHLIWVMLGCPKQEIFIRNLFMKIEQGLLIGSGAAMNFHIGEMKNQKFSIFGLRFIWLSRLISEPVKQSKRICKFFMIVPKILKKL
ncbi:WecB/TagA/CpsF family glycosyltransferase, partial [Akkermansiaceae bacterium]|nr:WecB/TagA/CpsF family glycosyltransferase [Akkermansiaceae bacterium]